MVVGGLQWYEVILVCLLRGGDPEGVGIEEEEEDHAEGHEVHVDEQEDAAVIEAPAALHAANRVGSSGGGGEKGEDKAGGALDLGEAGEGDGSEQTDQDKQNASQKGSLARIENVGGHHGPEQLNLILFPLDF
jgi:hypothetical protein